MTLATVAREAAVSQILRYELYRHESLIDRIQRIAPEPAQRRLDPRSHKATWQIIFYLCRCYYTEHAPTVTDVYLSAGISKVTAIKRLRDLHELGILVVTPDSADRRRKHVGVSPALKSALDRFVDDYVGDLRRMMSDSRGSDVDVAGQMRLLGTGTETGSPPRRATFLGDFSHEIRIALNSILGFSDAIRGEILGPLAPQGYREYANDIYGAGCHLQSLVNDLVDMAHAALTEGTPLSVDEVDAGEIVSNVVAASRETADHAGVDLAASVPGDLPALRADSRRLSQVLLSLIGHAIRHNAPGTRVMLEIETVDGAIRFRVRNAGDGAAPGEPSRPAEDGWSCGVQATADEPGAKLGLVLSRSIVQTLGGELRFETAPDGTANATVDLPLTPVTGNDGRGAPRASARSPSGDD